MLTEEIRGCIADTIALPLSCGQMLARILNRVNGATLEQVLAAAIAVAHEQVSQRIAELEQELDEAGETISNLEEDAEELRDRITNLLAEYASPREKS
jgi:phage shock protein A